MRTHDFAFLPVFTFYFKIAVGFDMPLLVFMKSLHVDPIRLLFSLSA